MKRKMLSVVASMLILICILTSCGHEHEWSEWNVDQKATYSTNGTESRYCYGCDEEENRNVEAYGDAGVYKLLNGHWRTKGASKDDFLIDILFEDSKFTATVYMYGQKYSYMGGSGTVEITDELITLKQSNGKTYIYFVYEIGDDIIVLIDNDIEPWEKYEP